MAGIRYLALADVLGLHDEVMRATGSRSATLRARSALESALARPVMAAEYARASLTAQAALLAIGISQAQAFTDGNKRTGYLTALVFQRLNGLRFVGDQMELARWIERAAVESADRGVVDGLARWLEGQVVEVR